MSLGLIALLDDIAALAKVAAASLDDVASQAAKAGAKAAGVVIDDAAVTPRYVTGFSAARELPIIGKIAVGSLKNKLLYLLPAALALSLLAPQAITPLLMVGGLYLCYEGAEKVYELISPEAAHAHEADAGQSDEQDSKSFEDQKVAGAIRTDFILSAEIMAITLGAIPGAGFWTQALILAVVGFGITLAVYGVVALIVKADDAGLALARVPRAGVSGGLVRAVGRGLVQGMPYFLKTLGLVGTAAMIWVGGGIILHGFESYGFVQLPRRLHEVGDMAAHLAPTIAPFLSWLVEAGGAGMVGLAIGAVAILAMNYGLSPLWRKARGAGFSPGKWSSLK